MEDDYANESSDDYDYGFDFEDDDLYDPNASQDEHSENGDSSSNFKVITADSLLAAQGYDFSSGVLQFEGQGYIPQVTSGACVMQIFGGSPHATTLMLRTYQGTLSYYRNPVVVQNIYSRWFKLNVIYNVDANKMQIYIDDLKFETTGRGGDTLFFKCGVYAQDDDSNYLESRWKNIKILKKNG